MICYDDKLCWYVMIACYDDVLWWHAMITCCDMMTCDDDMLWRHALMICYDDMLWVYAIMTCYDDMLRRLRRCDVTRRVRRRKEWTAPRKSKNPTLRMWGNWKSSLWKIRNPKNFRCDVGFSLYAQWFPLFLPFFRPPGWGGVITDTPTWLKPRIRSW